MNEEIKGENRAPTRTPLDVADERDEASMGIGRLRRSLRAVVRAGMSGEIGPGVSASVASAALLAVSTDLDPGARLAGDAWWAAVDGQRSTKVEIKIDARGEDPDRIARRLFDSVKRAHEVSGKSPELSAQLAEMAQVAKTIATEVADATLAERALAERDEWRKKAEENAGAALLHRDIGHALGVRGGADVLSAAERLRRTLDALVDALGVDDALIDPVATARALVAEKNGLLRTVTERDALIKRLDAEFARLSAWISPQHRNGGEPIPVEALTPTQRALFDQCKDLAGGAFELLSNVVETRTRTTWAASLHYAQSIDTAGLTLDADRTALLEHARASLRKATGKPAFEPAPEMPKAAPVAPYAVRSRAQKKAWTWARTEGNTGVVVRFDDVHRASDAVTDLVRATPNVEFQVVRYLTNGIPAEAFAEGPIRSWHGKPAKKGAKR